MNYKKSLLCAFFMTFLMMSVVSPVIAAKPLKDDGLPAGNHSPSGQHFTVNIIGVPNAKNENFEGGQGSRIFVLRTGTTMFYVHGDDAPFQILDRDATDGACGTSRASPGIILPYTGDAWRVQIYVRLLGPIDSSVKIRSEYYDAGWLPLDEFTLDRVDKKFQLKTGSLLADGYEDVLWYLEDKTNFRILQLRIYLDLA